MIKISVDTLKVSGLGNDILELSSIFNSDINSLYNRIYKVPRVTNEWIGTASINFASMVLRDKGQYIDYGNSLKKMGNILIEYASDIENAVKNNKIS